MSKESFDITIELVVTRPYKCFHDGNDGLKCLSLSTNDGNGGGAYNPLYLPKTSDDAKKCQNTKKLLDAIKGLKLDFSSVCECRYQIKNLVVFDLGKKEVLKGKQLGFLSSFIRPEVAAGLLQTYAVNSESNFQASA